MKEQKGEFRTVWLLGAGASVSGGIPIMSNYMAMVRYCYAHDIECHPDEKGRFKKALEYIDERIKVGALEEDVKDNMEAIFSLLDTEAELADDERKLQADAARPDLTFTVMRTFELCHVHGPADDRLRQEYRREKAREFYSRFVSDSIADHDAVITFNQDLLVDAAFLRAGLKPEYHLPEDTEDIHPCLKPEKSGPDLLKLHGSGNWYYCQEHKDKLFVHWFVEKDRLTENWAGSGMSGCCKQDGSNLDRLIIPPTWNKIYRKPFPAIWKKAYEHLTTATCLAIIGYSLPPTDQVFRFFLLSALAKREKPLERVVVVDKAKRCQDKDVIYDRWAFLKRFLIPKKEIQYHFDGFEVALEHLWRR